MGKRPELTDSVEFLHRNIPALLAGHEATLLLRHLGTLRPRHGLALLDGLHTTASRLGLTGLSGLELRRDRGDREPGREAVRGEAPGHTAVDKRRDQLLRGHVRGHGGVTLYVAQLGQGGDVEGSPRILTPIITPTLPMVLKELILTSGGDL